MRRKCCLILSVALSICAASASYGQTLQQVIEGAKKEGQVRVYSSMQKETVAAVTEAFRKKYPFVNKVEHHRFTGLDESERVLAELRVGRVDMDVLLVRSELWERHKPFIAGPIDWKALGVSPDRIQKNGFETTWAGGSVAGLAYNTKLVPPDKAPSRWEDCIDPRWKGKFTVYARPIFMMHLMPAWGEEKVIDFARKMAANQPVWDRDQTGAMEKVAAGEVPLYCGGDHVRWYRVHSKGAPVKLVTPEPVPTSEGRGISLVKGAKYPNTAKLLMAYLASDEAQLLIDKTERRGHRSVPGTLAHELTRGKKLSEFTEEWDLKSRDLSKKIIEAWGFPVAK
ncbi:MAG TPA: extracellular solute-binding protein [Candidatus Acidoferrales bacterium]|nr:extracellular solute-binding protein [Candidatus Acidoferrales bacterium]